MGPEEASSLSLGQNDHKGFLEEVALGWGPLHLVGQGRNRCQDVALDLKKEE